jgi:hypothetical protein
VAVALRAHAPLPDRERPRPPRACGPSSRGRDHRQLEDGLQRRGVDPEPARELGDRKAANIVATGAQVLVTANPGCLMQVTSAIERSGHPMGMAHTVEVLDASIRGAPVETLLPA